MRMKLPPSTDEIEARFWAGVDYDPHDTDRCWPFKGATQRGYGKFRFWDVSGKWCQAQAHRQAYILHYGEIDSYSTSKVEIDHLCHDPSVCFLSDKCPHRRCCNPSHLQLATRAVNNNRRAFAPKTHCPHGHAYDAANTYKDARGTKYCRTCHREQEAMRYQERTSLKVIRP